MTCCTVISLTPNSLCINIQSAGFFSFNNQELFKIPTTADMLLMWETELWTWRLCLLFMYSISSVCGNGESLWTISDSYHHYVGVRKRTSSLLCCFSGAWNKTDRTCFVCDCAESALLGEWEVCVWGLGGGKREVKELSCLSQQLDKEFHKWKSCKEDR